LLLLFDALDCWILSRIASGSAFKIRLCSRSSASMRAKRSALIRSISAARIDFRYPGQKGSSIPNQSGQSIFQPSVSRVSDTGHGFLLGVGLLARVVRRMDHYGARQGSFKSNALG
jgi:hypothetical protein